MLSFDLKDFLTFDKLLSSRLIRVLYLLGLIAGGLVAIGSLFSAFSKMRYDLSGGAGGVVVVLVLAIVGLLAWRLVCEAMILAFAMYDRLGEINENTRKS